jgi:carbamate kinase
MSKQIAVIAIGGNSLIKDAAHQTVEDQYDAATETCRHIADMIEAGYEVIIGHGNGPQVGFILRRSEIAAKAEGMHEVPLDVAQIARAPSAPCSNSKTSCGGAASRDPSHGGDSGAG